MSETAQKLSLYRGFISLWSPTRDGIENVHFVGGWFSKAEAMEAWTQSSDVKQRLAKGYTIGSMDFSEVPDSEVLRVADSIRAALARTAGEKE
jgi:hypothetical protein